MKMIILIIKDSDSDHVTQALTTADYRVTRVASTGGFLRSGGATMLLGVDGHWDGQAPSLWMAARPSGAS